MKKYIYLIFCFVFINTSFSQHFEKLSNGLSVQTFSHQQGIDFYLNQIADNGEIYNVYYDTVTSSFSYGKEYISVRLQIFTNNCWLFSKAIKLYATKDITAPRILDIEAIGNTVFISGSFDSSENNLGGGFIQFSNGNWQSCGINFIQKYNEQLIVNKLYKFNNKLLVTGNFDSIQNNYVNGILIYNNTGNWQNIGIGNLAGFNKLSNTSNTYFEVVNDSIMAFSRNDNLNDSFFIGGKGFNKIAVLTGNTFIQSLSPNKRILSPLSYTNLKCFLIQSNLGYANGLAVQLNNNTFQTYTLPDSFYTTTFIGHLNFGNLLYFIVQNSNKLMIDIYLFDGNIVTKKTSWKIANQYIAINMSTYSNKAVLSGNFNSISNNTFNDVFTKIALLNFEPACVISGNVFVDLNNDNIKQLNEPIVPNAIIFDRNLKINTMANKNGNYSLAFPTNKTVKLETGNIWGYVGNSILNISQSQDTMINYNFPYQASTASDLKISITSQTGNKILHGSQVNYTINLLNTSPNNQVVNLQVFHSPKTTQLIGENFTPNKNKNSFTFSPLIAPNSLLEFRFKMNYSSDSFIVNEKIKLTAMILTTDIDMPNNTDSVTQTISTQLASTSKTASPTTIQKNNQWLNYTISYKNEGTDTAVKVTILDTLDYLLDIARIEFKEDNVSLNNNVLQWNINQKLPPNVSGSVSFKMKVFSTATVGDSILNRATVYLAYLQPKTTNKVKVIFVKPTALEQLKIGNNFTIYPNPTTTFFQYINHKNIKGNIQIIDINGKIILEQQLTESDKIILPNTIVKGIYTIYIPQLNSAIGKICVQ